MLELSKREQATFLHFPALLPGLLMAFSSDRRGQDDKGSSHHVWKMPWAGDPRINLQPGGGGKAKPYQIRQLLQAIERLLQESKP